MTERECHRTQLARGWVEVWREADGRWGVSWEPYEGDPDFRGVTYTPASSPADFPAEYNPVVLTEWARDKWGGSR